MKLNLSAIAFSVAVGASILCVGCATSMGTASSEVAKPVLSVSFASTSMADDLAKVGLQRVFTDYWQAHTDRNWKHRFETEIFPRPLEERFYIAYHANAWALGSVKVTGVELTSQEASVEIALTLINPDKRTESVQYQKDKWKVVDGAWRHVVQDPMLSGAFQ